jgi:transposase
VRLPHCLAYVPLLIAVRVGAVIAREVVKHAEARHGFLLLPCRWVVERSFAWASRFRRLARDDERLPQTGTGSHFVSFACLMLAHFIHPLSSP